MSKKEMAVAAAVNGFAMLTIMSMVTHGAIGLALVMLGLCAVASALPAFAWGTSPKETKGRAL